MFRSTRVAAALVCAALLPLAAAGAPPPARTTPRSAPHSVPEPSALPESHFKGLAARSLGPAVMGGRVSDIALDPADPFRYYVALATGGLMRTTDNGTTFEAVFERQPVASIGAVAVAPSRSQVVYVGTGEANDRNSSGWGNGVYRSTDGGGTWSHRGLARSRAIARIVVHPRDPETAWVAAVGDLWQFGGERGLYKTTDGGGSWKAVLQAESQRERVGCGDVLLDPTQPDTLYAALYARRRTPWSFASGPELTEADVGGIFKSTDGGTSWRKLSGGLPGSTGRIGLDLSQKDPRVVYAVVQSHAGGAQPLRELRSRRGGLFRSGDGGETWTRVSDLNPRPFYFSQVRVDPQDDRRVYLLGFMLHVSEDGGRTFREDRSNKVHADLHALSIDPREPRRLLLGTDGGLYASFDRGEDWQHLARFAAGQFYRLQADLERPYRICGGLQDNVNWLGPSRTFTKDGIGDNDWINLGGGDGFYCAFHPSQRDVLFFESQQGDVARLDLRTGQRRELRPEPGEGQPRFRFHWASPLIPSRHHPGALYLAGNRVFRLDEDGEHWRVLSPDLSTRDGERTSAVGSGAETYGVVYTLAESPVQAGLLWAGTDDGKLWRSEDEGAHWNDLSASLPAAARGQWLSRIEASPHAASTAFLAVDAHRSGNDAPLAWRTTDAGQTWQDVTGDLPKDGPVKVLRQDPENPELLFAGTEFALFVSLDSGRHWSKLGGLPTVAVDDLLVHPREGDLLVATHGRSLYVLDDIRALREAAAARDQELRLFAPRPAEARHLLDGWVDGAGSTPFRGQNPPEGALISYWLRAAGEPVKIAVANAAGQPVANLSGPGTAGLQRVNWDLRPTKDLLGSYGSQGALFVPAGEYTLTLSRGEHKSTQKLMVVVPAGVETR